MSRLAGLVPLVLAAACALPREEVTRTSRAAIQGGTVNGTDTFAVAFLDAGDAVCSGTLIAPNLVLTARHCVAGGGGQLVDCSRDTFEPPFAADGFRVTLDQVSSYATAPYQVKKIIVPASNQFCGQDIALAVLEENVPASAATPIAPALTLTETTSITAIGYGSTDPLSNDEGTRHRLGNIAVRCIPGASAALNCDPSEHDMTTGELAAGNGLCGGDSGGGAYILSGAQTVVIGVLSRAAEAQGQCTDAIFTRTDAHAAFLVAGAKEAATLGGYAPPAWAGGGTTQAPPDVDKSDPARGDPPETTPTGGAATTTTSGCTTSRMHSSEPWGAIVLVALACLGRRKRR